MNKLHKLRVIKGKDDETEKPKTIKEESDITMSDPTAFPTGDASEEPRIKAAQEELRWMSVGREYAEEWQRIILLSLNGIKTMKNLADRFTSEDDVGMWVTALDTQAVRMEAVIKHLKAHTWELDGNPMSPEFLAGMEKCSAAITAANVNPSKDAIKAVYGETFDEMKKVMESAGFAFKTEVRPLVGEKLAFENEVRFKGKKVDG